MNPPESSKQTVQEQAARTRHLFDAVIDLDPGERSARLSQEQDAAVRQEVEALLEAYDRADEVLPPLEEPLPPPSEADALLCQRVAHYEVIEKLGGGGMGVVYRAWDTKLDRAVALKFLPPHLSMDERAKDRLTAEAKAASLLDHPNIAVVYEIGEHEGRLFIAMACYEGETLKKKIARGPLTIEEATGYAAQIAEGLQAAHEAGIMHRDIKPANVLVTQKSRVKVVDFGLAKMTGAELTQPGATLGTVAYMSPEQTRGEAVDHRTDLWSLGVVFYEMLTAEKPFGGESDRTLIHAIRHDAPEPVERLREEVPAGLAALVQRCLAKDPDERYQTAEDLLDDLRSVKEGKHVARRVRPRRKRALVYGSAAALLILLVVALRSLLFATGSGTTEIDSIAVLPLANLSGNLDQEYFADGMTEELISTLGQIEALRVISRTSVMRYKETTKTLPEIARELGVEAVVEGSVAQEGGRVRIQVRLVDGATEERLWERRFAQPMRNVLALQHEVARAIAREIEVSLTAAEEARLSAAPEVDPEAFDLYVRGTQARHKISGEGFREAGNYLTRAITRDSAYAPAHAGLASVYAFVGDGARAKQSAEKALELDPNLAEAHVALGLIRQFYDWNWMGAEDAFRQAIHLNPGYAEAHHELSMLLMRQKQFDEALRAAQHALYLAPMSARFQLGVGEVFLASGQYQEALVTADKTHALNPNFLGPYYLRGYAYAEQGRYEEAIEAWATCAALAPECGDYHRGHVGYIYAVSGRKDEALEIIKWLEARWRAEQTTESRFNESGLAFAIAQVYAGLGNQEQVLDWLERGVETGSFMLYLGIDPTLHSLHEEPRFQALLEKMGLAE